MIQQSAGYGLIAVGILFNNYVYLHDLVFDKHAGFIYVGWWSAAGILIGLGMVGLGVRLLTPSS